MILKSKLFTSKRPGLGTLLRDSRAFQTSAIQLWFRLQRWGRPDKEKMVSESYSRTDRIAQWISASDFGSEGRGFDSHCGRPFCFRPCLIPKIRPFCSPVSRPNLTFVGRRCVKSCFARQLVSKIKKMTVPISYRRPAEL